MMATLTVDSHREQMMRLLEAGRSYEFLTLAAPYLNVYPDDAYARLMAIREYVRLGLIVPARELLEVETKPGDLPPEFASIRESLATVSGAAIPWSLSVKRFEDNLASLSDRGVDVTTISEAWAAGHAGYQRFRDANGLDQVRMRDGEGRWRWIPRLGDGKSVDAARPLPEGVGELMPGPYLFEGLDLGWYFQRVYEATCNTFLGYSCALFVVEADPTMLALVLHLHDWRAILSDARVFWFIGDSCTSRLRQVWQDDPDLPFPRQAFTLSTSGLQCSPGAVEVVENAVREREAAIAASLKDVEARYASRDVHYWARRFDEALRGRGAPLRILAAVSTHTTFLKYSMRDAIRAFESLGHNCTVLTEKTPYDVIGPLAYHNVIRDFDPDLFFNIDHLRPEFDRIIPANLPLLSWDQDQLPNVFSKSNMERIGKLDFVVGYSKSKCVAAGVNPKQLLNARVPTCPEQFSGDALTAEELERYACDVSYVSHASQTPLAFHEEERAVYKEAKLQELLDTLYALTPPALARYRVMADALANDVLDEALQRCGVTIKDRELRTRLTGWYLWRLGDRIFRHEALEWVAGWARRNRRTLRIYGNGWDKHPTLSEFAAGPADNGRELLCIYRASRINLQLMPAGFIHQRALDGLAGGGFFLSRATPGDLRGRTIRKLDARIRELGIANTRELLGSADTALQTLVRDFFRDQPQRIDPNTEELFNNFQILAEFLHPQEVFPNFSEILFDSESEFVQKADMFLANGPRRREIIDEMRQVVIEHFGYRPTMDRFLRAMADYLREACA